MIDIETARRAWYRMEAVHGMIYFAPEATERFVAMGATGRAGYFGSRSAPMGAVPDEVVIATFFNFRPGVVREAMAIARSAAQPQSFLVARLDAADAALSRAFGSELGSPKVRRAADLAEQAARSIIHRVEGKPLFAGHASLDWPDSPHLRLWHAQSLLREFRGDAHVAALLTAGFDGLDALLTHAGTGKISASVLRTTRDWTVEEWSAGFDRLRDHGILDGTADEPTLTETGSTLRQKIEAATDRATAQAYDVLGSDGCVELTELGKFLSAKVVDAGLLPGR